MGILIECESNREDAFMRRRLSTVDDIETGRLPDKNRQHEGFELHEARRDHNETEESLVTQFVTGFHGSSETGLGLHYRVIGIL